MKAGLVVAVVAVLLGTCGMMDAPQPPATVATPTPLTILHEFLYADNTSEAEYIFGVHDCIEFSIELAYNLTDAGYDAGTVETYPIVNDVGCGHVICWVRVDNVTFYIEPQDDIIFTPGEYIETFNTSEFQWVEMSIPEMEDKILKWRCV